MHLRQIDLIDISLHPDRAQVAYGVEHVTCVYVLPLGYLAFGHDTAGGGVDRQIDLWPVRGPDRVDLLWSQSPEFQPATAGRDQFIGTGDCLRLSTVA